jgi:hypothetical protein
MIDSSEIMDLNRVNRRCRAPLKCFARDGNSKFAIPSFSQIKKGLNPVNRMNKK